MFGVDGELLLSSDSDRELSCAGRGNEGCSEVGFEIFSPVNKS